MKKLLALLGLCITLAVQAQVPTLDSLHKQVNRYVNNAPVEAFKELRLNNILHGILFRIDSISGGGSTGVDTLYQLNDSTIRYRRNGNNYDFNLNGIYDSRIKTDTLYALNDSTLRATFNGVEKDIVIKGNGGTAVAEPTLDDQLIVEKTLQDTTGVFNKTNALTFAALNNNSLLAVGIVFSGATSDDGQTDLYKWTSNDNGKTWSTGSLAIAHSGTNYPQTPSLYKKANGDLLMLGLLTQGADSNWIVKWTSSNNGTTWSSATRILLTGRWFGPMGDRLFKWGSRLYYPFSINTNGDPSTFTGNHVGKLLYSDDEGATWDTASWRINSPDSLCIEPGIYHAFDNNGNDQLIYYWRSRSGVVYARALSPDGETLGSQIYTNIKAPNSTVTIKQIGDEKNWVALHSPFIDTIGTSVRRFLAISRSSNGRYFEYGGIISKDSNTIYYEPSLTVIDNKHLLCTYTTTDESKIGLPAPKYALRYFIVPASRIPITAPAGQKPDEIVNVSANIELNGGSISYTNNGTTIAKRFYNRTWRKFDNQLIFGSDPDFFYGDFPQIVMRADNSSDYDNIFRMDNAGVNTRQNIIDFQRTDASSFNIPNRNIGSIEWNQGTGRLYGRTNSLYYPSSTTSLVDLVYRSYSTTSNVLEDKWWVNSEGDSYVQRRLGIGITAPEYELHVMGQGRFGALSGYLNSYTYAQLGNQDFVAKEQLEEALSTVNSTISIGELMTGVGSIADPINPDTSAGKIATKTDVELAKDSIGRTEGIDSFQVYRNGIHIYSVKDSVGGVAEGTGDNWGTQGVLADSYHSGTGKVGDTLRIDTSALFPAIRETIPNAPFPGLFGGTGITISGNDETGYTVVNTGSPGSNPRAALSILDFGGARDAIIPSTGSVPTSGTDNTPALNNMIAAAQDGQVCYIPYGNYWFKTAPDTIGKYNKRVILIIDGNTYHINTSGAGINFLVFKNLSGPFEQHYVEHNGVCFGKINPATHSNSAHDAGTGPVWSAYTGTAFTVYNCNQNYIRFNKIEGFKNGLEVIGQDYDAAGRGSQENTFVGRWLYKNANDIVLTSLNGSSYCDKNKFFVDRVSGGLGIKIDGYSGLSQYNDPISGVQENWNGAFRSNEFHLMIEGVDSVADVYGDVTEPEFDVTIEGSGVYGDHGWRLKSTSPNYVRDPKFNGQGVYGYQWVQEGMGINARGDVPIWNSTSGRRFSNTWKTDGSGNVVFVGSTLTKFQRDDSPTTFLYAPGNDAESDKAITASTYTASAGEVIQYSNASGTITLPSAGSNVGKRITIMNTHASASVTIANAANYTSIPAGDNMTYRSDGNNWRGIVNAEGSGGGGGGGDSTFTFDTNGKTTTYKLGVRTASKSNSAFAFPASTTSVSSFNVPTGSHPTSPADGDEWRVAKARYMAYNGITYEYLTVPDNGQAGQIVRRNAANDGYEHAYPNFEVAYSLTTSIASTGASSSSKTSLTGGAQTLNPVSTGDIIELHGAGTIATASSGTPAPTFDLVFGSSATTFNTTTLAANKLYQYRYDIRITVGNKWDVKLEISESSGGGSLAPVVYWQSGNGTTGLVTSAPVINLRSWFTNADNLLTAYSSTIEIKR